MQLLRSETNDTQRSSFISLLVGMTEDHGGPFQYLPNNTEFAFEGALTGTIFAERNVFISASDGMTISLFGPKISFGGGGLRCGSVRFTYNETGGVQFQIGPKPSGGGYSLGGGSLKE